MGHVLNQPNGVGKGLRWGGECGVRSGPCIEAGAEANLPQFLPVDPHPETPAVRWSLVQTGGRARCWEAWPSAASSREDVILSW